MNLDPLLFRPQDGNLLLEGKWDKSFDADNRFHPLLGRFVDIEQRSQSCSLCKLLVNIIREHVDPTFLKNIGADDSHNWQLHFSAFGGFGPRIVNPPYTKNVCRLSVNIIKRFSDGQSRANCVLEHAIQGATRVIPTINDFLDRTASNLNLLELQPSGRLYSPICEIALFRRWLRDCEETHGCSARQSMTTRKLSLRLIDTARMCIVEFIQQGLETPRYCALSYVWGMNLGCCSLTKSNHQDLMQPGGINTLQLPQTISDAVYVVKALEQRYLWVDALCIKQDDPGDQKLQIPNMRHIYSRAILTIIAAAGDNADSGLPGLKPGQRAFKQECVILENMALLNCSAPSRDFWSIHVSSSKWNTRGWTMQERLFSTRCLIFTEKQVYWECHGGSWCEETRLEASFKFRFDKRPMDNFFLDPSFQDSIPASHLQRYAISHYKKSVEDYAKRNLSFDHDAVNAFAGSLDFFLVEASISCFWGITIPDFESALCWFGRSDIIPRVQVDFPSWSWVAWRHYIEFINLDQGRHLIQAHKIILLDDGSKQLVAIGSEQVPHHPIHHGAEQPLQQRRCPTISEICSRDLPLLREDFHLVFWTSTAAFQLGSVNSIETNFYTEIYPPTYSMLELAKFSLDPNKAWPSRNLSKGAIGFCFGILSDSILDQAKNAVRLEFILLSTCLQQPHPYPRLRKPLLLMLVSWNLNSTIAKREAMALVEQDDWLAAQPSERLVLLG
jgi:hypothetical protein